MTGDHRIDADRWLLAEPAQSGCVGVLPPGLIARWREHGAILVSGILTSELVSRLAKSATAHFPQARSADAAKFTRFGADLCFPSECDGLNDLTLHPRLIGAVADLLDVSVTDLRLTQSDVWPKYGGGNRPQSAQDNADQRIHVDYPNHSLVHPSLAHRRYAGYWRPGLRQRSPGC